MTDRFIRLPPKRLVWASGPDSWSTLWTSHELDR